MTEVIMPKMGDGMEEGTLLEWLKKEGEAVKSGESIANIQTDKATLEMPADGSGTLAGILIKEGETVPVGRPIALLLAPGESVPAGWSGAELAAKPSSSSVPQSEFRPPQSESVPLQSAIRPPQSESVPPQSAIRNPQSEIPSPASSLLAAAQAASASSQTASTQPAPAVQSPVSSVASAVSPTTPQTEVRAKASPLARRVAEELGVSLTEIMGTGPGGRIVEKDVRSAASSAPLRTPEPPNLRTIEPTERLLPLNKIRQITARVTAASKQQVPHFYVTVEVDVERIMDLREQFAADGIDKPSLNDFVIRACALALRQMPVVNSSFAGDHIRQHDRVNIGMAVALDDGLTLPVIQDADLLALTQIGPVSKDLAQKAHANRLSLHELSGATFSISNMGMLNVDDFSAIIVQPNAAIVAVSTARRVVVPVEDDTPPETARSGEGRKGERSGPPNQSEPIRAAPNNPSAFLEVRRRMNLTGSFDHRVVDGAVGAKFMNLLRDYLQNPTRLLA